MARLNAETPATYLPVEVSTTPGRKGAIDPSLIGVFDEALRQVARPQRDSRFGWADEPPKPPTSAESAKTPEPGKSPEVEEAEQSADREDEGTRPEDAEAASKPEEEGKAKDKEPSEKDGSAGDSASQEAGGGKEADSDSGSDETTAKNETTVEEAPGGKVGKESAEGEEAEQASAEKKAAEQAKKAKEAAAKAASNSGEGTTASVDGEQVVEETSHEAKAKAGVEAAAKEGESGGEGDQKLEKKSAAESAKQETSLEELAAGKPAEGEASATSDDDSGDRPRRRSKGKRAYVSTAEKQQAAAETASKMQAAQSAAGQTAPADSAVSAEPARSPMVENVAIAPPPQTTAPVDPGPGNHGGQSTGTIDAVSSAGSRTTSGQPNPAAGPNMGKGTAQGVDSAKFVQRVANAFAALGERSGPVRLKLYPPELGSLRMEIRVKNGTLSARVEAETAAAKGLLLDNLPMLRDRLAEQGIKVDRFDVGVSDQSEGGASERPNDGDGRPSQQPGRERQRRAGVAEGESETSERHDEPRPPANGRLDVFI